MVDTLRFPSLTSIRAFEAAARLGSFAEAGRELGTSSASVSYHVRQLEAQIGARLFHRHPHRVELTDAGQLVAGEATSAFAALRASFVKAAEAEEGLLSLTTLPTFGAAWLSPKLGRFRTLHSQVRVQLELSEAAEDLTSGRYDAAIRNGHGHWPGLRTAELLPSLFMPLCTPALRAVAAGVDDPHRSLDVPLLGRPDWWTLWYRAQGHSETPPPERFGTSLSTEQMDVAAALSGHGVAIASPILFASEIEAGRLVPAHDFVAGDGRTFWFVYPVARRSSRKVVLFREWLCDEAARVRETSRAFIRRAVIVRP
ncbi:LysR substrate-binding domain-containing protein [Sphingosinicella sp. CPCC 101087]|uniref:LysR substrate-binding domain-containing protein n=1 Tax=Sphingosinicella sp. CPCC 101087 TaxID=2497754 RepID=UPI00101CD951|nr:LysR substrate-binding domain-containing protein [Sphingosinicella sp. CPCC 101087]